jgi:hypothetical protein
MSMLDLSSSASIPCASLLERLAFFFVKVSKVHDNR